MKKVLIICFALLMSATCAFAASETIDELIAQLEGKTPEEIAQEVVQKQQEKDEAKFAEELEKERKELIKKKLWSQTDKFNGTVAYRSNRTTRGRIAGDTIFLIIHDTTSGPSLVCRFGFTKSEFIYMRGIQLNIDGDFYSVQMFGTSEKPYHGWEYYDDPVTSNKDEAMYRKIINSKRTMVRFTGLNGIVDFEVSLNQKKAMSEVMRYHYIRQYQFERKSRITMEQYLEKVADLKL